MAGAYIVLKRETSRHFYSQGLSSFYEKREKWEKQVDVLKTLVKLYNRRCVNFHFQCAVN